MTHNGRQTIDKTDIIGTNLLTMFDKDYGGHVFQPTGMILNHLTKFHEDRTIYVAYREKYALSPGGHVFQPTGTIFDLLQDIIGTNRLTKFHYDRTINVAFRVLTRKNAPPPGGNVFQATVTIFKLVQNIAETNLLSKCNDDRTIHVAPRGFNNANFDATRCTTHNALCSTLCSGELTTNPSETLAFDKPYPSLANIQYDKAISHIEPPREKEEMAA
ncbi:hypothetical protein DPMN_144763 [Dreissena polymorpha]|uniref:Uncharacterized protein n=1 Tax=Dreissena polymorpha TaxID=45954 RepID=A0A9D4F7F0_DREPO|nr:hypothetical protein DPMN_144763 [Dreissena polymorpha]